MTHIPTGLQASASEERSQHRNKASALARLSHRLEALKDQQRGEAERGRIRRYKGATQLRVFREASVSKRPEHT